MSLSEQDRQTMSEKSDYNCTYNATEADTAQRIALTININR